jgi:hypothetical protein
MKYFLVVFLTACDLFTPPDDVTFRGKAAELLVEELETKK